MNIGMFFSSMEYDFFNEMWDTYEYPYCCLKCAIDAFYDGDIWMPSFYDYIVMEVA